jgi:hypothetical protein
LTLLFGAALVASCGDSANQVIAGPEPNAGTRIRFFNFSLNAPGVHFYAGDVKVAGAAEVGFTQDAHLGTAIGGTESVTGTICGGVTSGGYYNSIAAGPYTFNARIAPVTDNGLKIANLNTTIVTGKMYSVFLSGLYDPVAKTTDAFIVEDPVSPTYDWNNVQVRFVNGSYNSSPMTLYAKNQTTLTETALGGDVTYKGAGAFVTLVPGIYDFRAAVGTANPFTRLAVTLTAGKIYTITARGSATSGAFLDNTANR